MARAKRTLVGLFALALAAGACGRSTLDLCATVETCAPTRTWTLTSPGEAPAKLDLLMIVDDSPRIAPYASKLAAFYRQLANVLATMPGGLPSLHVAVTSAPGVQATCAARSTRAAGCGVRQPGQFIATQACGAQPNFDGSFADTLACLADLGSDGCGGVQPLAAIQPALDGMSGFRRSDAVLVLLIVAAADDASGLEAPRPVTAYVDLLQRLTTHAPRFVSVIGPPGSCAANQPGAAAAPRLCEMVNAFRGSGVYVGLDSDRLIETLVPLGERIGPARALCLDGIRDSDSHTAGLQPNCVVRDTVTRVDGTTSTTALANCNEAPPPCWRLLPGPTCRPHTWTFEVERAADWCAHDSATDIVTCTGCTDPADPACAGP